MASPVETRRTLEVGQIVIDDVCPLSGMTPEELSRYSGGSFDPATQTIAFGPQAGQLNLASKQVEVPAWENNEDGERVYHPISYDMASAVTVVGVLGTKHGVRPFLDLVLPNSPREHVLAISCRDRMITFIYLIQSSSEDPSLTDHQRAIFRANSVANRLRGS